MLLLLPMKRVLPQGRVVLLQFQALLGISLVFSCGHVVFAVLRAHKADNLSGFGFFRHGNLSIAVEAARETRDSLKSMNNRGRTLQPPRQLSGMFRVSLAVGFG